jgi:hypothetical protein
MVWRPMKQKIFAVLQSVAILAAGACAWVYLRGREWT